MAAVLDDDPLTAPETVPLVSITALARQHGDHEVLRGVDLNVMRGEIVAVVGASGAGKSTLLRCVAGLERFQSGGLSVQGRPVSLIFQGLNLLPQLTVGQNVMQAPALALRPGAAGQARELLARVGMAEAFDTLPGELTAAQQQRVVIARALAPEPALLLCDDLTSPDDPEQAGEVGLALQALAADGLAVLLATQDAGLARAADRVVLLRDGRARPG